MNITPFRRKTDLHRLYEFIKPLETLGFFEIEEQDWDNMCGILVKDMTSGIKTCYNFHEDGSFRSIIPVPDQELNDAK